MDTTDVTVRAVRAVGPDTIAIQLDAPAEFDAKPGQFVQLAVTVDGNEEARHYTLSSPDTDDLLEVTVGVDPDGTVGPYLESLEPGDTVGINGPFGHAFYEGEPAVTLVVGGPGVGPGVGIAERVLQDGGDVAVVYLDDTHAHTDRLASLADHGADVFLVGDNLEPAVDAALSAVGGQVFVYGFSEFVREVADLLEERGIDTDDAKIESFG
ncbi:FAD-binding oxidoreductase [Salarchaeum sp. III]|uniref:ferredoxin--NADP reductase n=1 Tax=Salarchaeum sp. III TaxID=3107927 RepID=UPI002ED82A32